MNAIGRSRMRRLLAIGLLVVPVAANVAHAQPQGSDRCEIKKIRATSSYASCRYLAEWRAVRSGNPVDFATCDDRLTRDWDKAERYQGVDCPDGRGPLATLQADAETHTDTVAVGILAPAAEDEEPCSAKKIRAAGQATRCRLNAEAKALAKNDGRFPQFTRCSLKLNRNWARAEGQGGADCPGGSGVLADVTTEVETYTDSVRTQFEAP